MGAEPPGMRLGEVVDDIGGEATRRSGVNERDGVPEKLVA